MHFTIYVGSELELFVKRHTNKAHFSTAWYHFDFLKKFGLSHAAAEHGNNCFIELSKQGGSMSFCETKNQRRKVLNFKLMVEF